MHQSFRSALGLMTLMVVTAGEARAQFYGGYGGYGGWGGWGGGGSTPIGDFARGAGYYAMGAGVYNLDSAQAASINADTIMRWNEYMFLSQQEANRREYMRRARVLQRDVKSGEAIETRIRENPEDRDIRNGDALNAILHQLTDPKIHSTALRLIRDPIDSKTIRSIPFENASEAVTISLDELTGEGDWPVALRGPTFAAERKAYTEAIDKAVKEDEEGILSAATLQEVERAGAALRLKLETNRPANPVQAAEAANYIKALVAMSRMLQKPDVDKILAELEKVKETSLGSLLAFMHAYNLRFAPAKNAAQSAVYSSLYPPMAAARDRIVASLKDSGAGATAPVRDDRHAISHYSALTLEPLNRGASSSPAKP
jgi:hypothetical protein